MEATIYQAEFDMNKKNEDQSKSQQEQPKPGQKFSQEQYDMLKRCSEKEDMTEWNEWREEHLDEKILLEGANFEFAYFSNANLQSANLNETNLEGAELMEANLKGARLHGANLKGVKVRRAKRASVEISGANLEGADLLRANLKGADLWLTNLEGAGLWGANLKDAGLYGANLKGAYLDETNLEGAEIMEANLEGASFRFAIVDGYTLFKSNEFDRFTDFTGVGLNNARVEPGTKQLFEYNIRRLRWEEWYRKHPCLGWFVWLFWSISNYGLSTWRIVLTFFGLALLFAAVYSNLAYWYPPGIINELFVESETTQKISLLGYFLVVLFRPVYFSVVTMTTLGFGDMYARAWSWGGHILLMLQVILGYVLLGALVTRFAILFTAGGPADRFPKKRIERDKGSIDKLLI